MLIAAALVGCSTSRTTEGSPMTGSSPQRSAAGMPASSASPADSARESPAETEQVLLDQQLRDAAWNNDVPAALSFIEAGADVNAKDDTVQSAYLIATSEGYLELLRLALRSGAAVDDEDSWNGTGLIRAAERGHFAVVGRLLQAGISRDHVNRIGYQAVHEAVWFGDDTDDYANTLRVLAAGGAQLDRPSRDEQLTPSQMARQRGYQKLDRVLTRMRTDKPPADADAALLRAAAAGDADGVALAIRAGAELEARDDHQRTSLLLAATHDHVETAKVLVALGANPDALDDRHDTPWLVTGVTGSPAMLETLLAGDPDLTIENRYGGVSIIPASERGHVEYVRRVVRTGIDVDHVNRLGWTALLEAVILGDGGPRHQEIVRILLAAGANEDIADRAGVTAREHAQSKGYDEIADTLGG